MKLSMNWMKDYADLPDGADLEALAKKLTMSTVEVEDVVRLADNFEKMVVGVVTEMTPHPDADRLRVCRTDIGSGQERTIVCGGINVAEGMKVAVACPGSMVRWHGEGEPVELGVARVRGLESWGMICASSEIGLFDLFPFEHEATIMDLSEFDAPAGTPLAQALGLEDVILDIDNKSLTNRPDLWGHYGMAREISALCGVRFKELATDGLPADFGEIPVSIEDPAACPRYIGASIEGLSVKDAPYSMRRRLWTVGMRPVNAIVDITNYVMLATGQPTHAFDADAIKEGITVRRAQEGETLDLLNGRSLALACGDLVIADAAGPVGLAGIMGGEKDSVLPTTTRIILETANFDAMTVRAAASRHEIRTEAATRFEKAIDPERCALALSLALTLLGDVYPESALTALRDVFPSPPAKKTVTVSLEWLERRLGLHIPEETVSGSLTALGFGVDIDEDSMTLAVPSWRATGDVSLPADIVEEVARMHGYDNFVPAPVSISFSGAVNQTGEDLERRIKEYLAFRCGMQEVLTYPWMHVQFVEAILGGTEGVMTLAAPPSPEERFVRSSLLPNLVRAVGVNQRNYAEFSLFETAQTVHDRDYSSPSDPRESLPFMERMLAAALAGPAETAGPLFRKAKGIIEAMPGYTHMEAFSFSRESKPLWAEPAAWLNVTLDGHNIGNLGLLSKKAALECGIKAHAVALFELNTDALRPFASRTNSYARLPEYPVSEYDVSMLFGLAVRWEDIASVASSAGGGLVMSVSHLDEYTGPQVPPDKKSVTMRLTIGSPEKTLTSKDIEAGASDVTRALQKQLGASLRSQ